MKSVNLTGKEQGMFNSRSDSVIFELPVSPDYTMPYIVAETLFDIANVSGGKIPAIKVLRAFSQLGLKESKDIVDYILAHFVRIYAQ